MENFHQSQSHIYNIRVTRISKSTCTKILSNCYIDPIKLPLKCNFHPNSCKNPLPFLSSSLMVRDQSTRKGVRKRLKRESCEEAVSFGRSEDSVGTSFQAKRQHARRCYSVQLLLASFCSLNQFPLPFPPPTPLPRTTTDAVSLPPPPPWGIYQDHHCAGSLESMIRRDEREREKRIRKSCIIIQQQNFYVYIRID